MNVDLKRAGQSPCPASVAQQLKLTCLQLYKRELRWRQIRIGLATLLIITLALVMLGASFLSQTTAEKILQQTALSSSMVGTLGVEEHVNADMVQSPQLGRSETTALTSKESTPKNALSLIVAMVIILYGAAAGLAKANPATVVKALLVAIPIYLAPNLWSRLPVSVNVESNEPLLASDTSTIGSSGQVALQYESSDKSWKSVLLAYKAGQLAEAESLYRQLNADVSVPAWDRWALEKGIHVRNLSEAARGVERLRTVLQSLVDGLRFCVAVLVLMLGSSFFIIRLLRANEANLQAWSRSKAAL